MALSVAVAAAPALDAPLVSGHAAFTAHRYVLDDGASLACYTRSGEPTLVLVPGTGRDRTTFFETGFVDHLDPFLGVVIIEMRGRGQSWPPPQPSQATVEQYASDVLEVIRGLKLSAWYIGGHSLGGMISWEIGGRDPEGLRGVIPLEGWVHHSVSADAFGEDIIPKEKIGIAPKPKDVPPGWTEDQEIALITMWRRWNGGERAVRNTVHSVLAVVGDRGLSPRPTRDLLKLPDRTNIELSWVRGAGHDVLAAKFVREVAEAVNHFIARVEARARGPN